MITNKRYQKLLMLATTGKPLPDDATPEEEIFYKEVMHDYEVMHKNAELLGIKDPILEIPFEID